MVSMHKPLTSHSNRSGQRGSVLVLFVLTLPLTLGFIALAVDIARIMLVKAELQNAADAGALAAVSVLKPSPTGQSLNEFAARTQAHRLVTNNSANGQTLVNSIVEVGYWNTQNPSLGLQALGTIVPGANDLPAVKVTVKVDAQNNNGPLPLYFAGMLGYSKQDVQAHAVAVLPAVDCGQGLFPLAINRCMVDGLGSDQGFWDRSAGKPRIDPTTGQPYILNLGSTYFGSCRSGAWTTYPFTTNDVATIQNYIDNGFPDTVTAGSTTYIPDDVDDAIYNGIPDKDVIVAVVNNINPDTSQPIYALAGFRITGGNSASQTVTGHFVEKVTLSGGRVCTGTGQSLGAYTPPKLVNSIPL
jgi:Flp pilus assembly protein TadG